jgi:hypothetical protein
MQKVKKVFHSFKELQEEWQRQGIVKPDDERINNFRIVPNGSFWGAGQFVVETKYDDAYSDETDENNFIT